MAFFAIFIAVTILPAGAAGDAIADLEAFAVVVLAVVDFTIDFLETAMIVTSGMYLNCCTARLIATHMPNTQPSKTFLYSIENRLDGRYARKLKSSMPITRW